MNVVEAANIIEVTLLGRCADQAVQNKFHYAVTEVDGPPEPSSDVFDTLHANLTAGGGLIKLIQLMAPEDYEIINTRYQVISPVRQVGYPKVTNMGGLNTFNTQTANVAFCITKRGDLAGRKNISTSHIIGTTDPALMEDGLLTPAAKTLAQTIADFINNEVSFTVVDTAYDLGSVIFHPTDPLNPTPITSCVVQDTVRVMRRRTVGLGI